MYPDYSEDALKDHPRACGENLQKTKNNIAHRGSPPRMRGKRGYSGISPHTRRITPAHAGKTLLGTIDNIYGKDHPRACGENTRAVGRL